jgi:gamma-glutamylcyclotransferase
VPEPSSPRERAPSSAGATYFAYGSNMDEQNMSILCPSSRCLGAARLEDFRLAFRRRSRVTHTGVADILSALGESTWGVFYELDNVDLGALDYKEGRGFAYTRIERRVQLARDGSRRDATMYTVIAKTQYEVAPSHAYLARMLAAASRHAFPAEYLAMLAAVVPVP